MDQKDRLNFSTDLLRISNWIYFGQDSLVEKFIDICDKKYRLEEFDELISKVKRWKKNRYLAADAASTLSRLVMV